MSFFHFEQSWWEARYRPNVLLVHYRDLKTDLSGEMQRVADFLNIDVAQTIWPALVQAAEFETMRRDGDALMGNAATAFKGGSRGFFFQGTNERWRSMYGEGDLALYDAKVKALLSADCAQWVAQGRLQDGISQSIQA
jgi:aryl sulfotransferase